MDKEQSNSVHQERKNNSVHEDCGQALHADASPSAGVREKYISIEQQTLMGDTWQTYFVDLVTVAADGHKSHSNIRSVTNVHLARQIARELARAIPSRVDDETMLVQRA